MNFLGLTGRCMLLDRNGSVLILCTRIIKLTSCCHFYKIIIKLLACVHHFETEKMFPYIFLRAFCKSCFGKSSFFNIGIIIFCNFVAVTSVRLSLVKSLTC